MFDGLADLTNDVTFRDFNFSEIYDPHLKAQVRFEQLLGMVYLARAGDRFAGGEFIDAYRWTQRPETFDAFQRAHGPRPILFRDWFYNKLELFFRALTYRAVIWSTTVEGEALINPFAKLPADESAVILGAEGDGPSWDILIALFPWPAARALGWEEVFVEVFRADGAPGDALRRILASPRGVPGIGGTGKQWRQNEARDRIVLQCLEQGEDPRKICRILDERFIPPDLPKLRMLRIRTWLEGYDHPNGHNAIQQLFIKIPQRRNSVKSE
jgi:hypothetical protein